MPSVVHRTPSTVVGPFPGVSRAFDGQARSHRGAPGDATTTTYSAGVSPDGPASFNVKSWVGSSSLLQPSKNQATANRRGTAPRCNCMEIFRFTSSGYNAG